MDPIAEDIPNYPLIIKHPMDLQTMENKLKKGMYPSERTFKDDLGLMIRNTESFNGPDHDVTLMAKLLGEVFEWFMNDGSNSRSLECGHCEDCLRVEGRISTEKTGKKRPAPASTTSTMALKRNRSKRKQI